jgi:hypothetical protein
MHTAASYSALGRHAEALDMKEQGLAFVRRVLPADHSDIATALYNIFCSLHTLGSILPCSWFAHKALHVARSTFSDSHLRVLKYSGDIRQLTETHGPSAIQPPPTPSSV